MDDISEIIKLYEYDWDADRPNRDRMISDMEFLAGEQWDEADRLARSDDNKPTHTINRLPQFVRQVVGDIRQTTPSITVKPSGSGSDEETAEIINGLVRQIVNRSQVNMPFVNAVDCAAKGGVGYFRINHIDSPDNPFNRDIVIDPIYNSLSVVFDAGARQPTRADADHCFVVDAMTPSQFENEFPKAKKVSWTENDSYRNRQWFDEDKVKVCEFWERYDEKAEYALLENGYVLRTDKKPAYWRYDELNQAFIDERGEYHYIADRASGYAKRVRQKIVSGVEILETNEWPGQYLPIVAVVGDQVFFPDRVDRFSLVHWAVEPQRMFNYWRSTQAGIIGSALKSAIPIGVSQLGEFAGDIDAAIKGNKPWFPYDDSKNSNPPRRLDPPRIEPAIMNEVSLAADDMKATTGIYDAALGNRSNETSGVAIRSRQAESDISTSLFGDNLQAAIEQAGRIIVDMIPNVYDASRALRIVHEDNSEEQVNINQLVYENGVPRIYNDLTTGTYDVTAKVGASFATRRQESLEMLTELLRGSPQMVGGFFDLLVELADIPKADSFVKRARKMLPPGLVDGEEEGQDPNPAQAQQQQQAQAMQQRMAEIAMKKEEAQATEAIADAEKAKAEAMEAEIDVLMKRVEANGRMAELQAYMAGLAR